MHDAPVPRAALVDAPRAAPRRPRRGCHAGECGVRRASRRSAGSSSKAKSATRTDGKWQSSRGCRRCGSATLSFEASLFVGFLLWDGEQTLRLSDDKLVALAPLRTRERINLCGRGTQPSDLAVLLGALSQNTACVDANDTGDVEEVDANGAPATAPAGVVQGSGRLPGGSRTIREIRTTRPSST